MPTSPSPPNAFIDKPRSGVVALLDRASIAVTDLALGPEGVTARRWVLAFNGAKDLRYIDSDPASAVAALARVLQDNGFPRKLLCVGLTDSIFGAALTDVPKTSADALSALIVKRVREQVVDPPGDLLADHSVIGLAGGAPGALAKGYLAWSDKALMQAFVREFAAHKLEVGRIMPPAIALLDLFGRTRPADPPRLELFARYCFPSLVIAVYGGNDPLYLRFLPDLMADTQDSVATTVLKEVQRTAAFAMENHQGRRVERLCFSGLSAADARSLVTRMVAETGIVAEPLLAPVVSAPQEADSQRLAVFAGMLLHGAPVRGRRVRPMDLLPRPPRRLTRSVLALGSAAAVALLAGLLSLSLGQDAVKAGSADVAALEREFSALSADTLGLDAARERAQSLETHAATLGVLGVLRGNPVQPLLETWLLVPREALIAAASLDNPFLSGSARPRLDLRLSGDFSSDAGSARLRACTAALQARPWCGELAVTQGGVKATTGKPGLAESVGVGAWLR